MSRRLTIPKRTQSSTSCVQRARKTDREEPAAANVSTSVAKCIVGLMKAAGTELVEALWFAGIIEKSSKGTSKLSVTNLNLLFQCHCVVMRGKHAEKYYPSLYARATAKNKTLCILCMRCFRPNGPVCAHLLCASVRRRSRLERTSPKEKAGSALEAGARHHRLRRHYETCQ